MPSNVDEVLYRDESMALAAGELAAASAGQAAVVEKKWIQQDEIEVKLAWTHGMLLFQGDSLEDVLKEMSRYTTTRIEADDTIKAIHVEAYLKAGDIDGLLAALQKNVNVQARTLGDGSIRLYGGG